jgi:hypothetical protein
LLEVVAEGALVTEVDLQTTMHGLAVAVAVDLYIIQHILLFLEQRIQ